MDKKRYRKTRYENIYQNIKNKNYIITISNPKTTISDIDGKKIYDLDLAKKLRDNDKIKMIKKTRISHIDNFKSLWEKYMFYCEYTLHLEYNTLKKKRLFYNRFISEYFDDMQVTKIEDKDIIRFFNSINTTDNQKNHILKEFKPFFNWCVKQKYILFAPTQYIKKYKVQKSEMKYWLPEHLKTILDTINDDIENGSIEEKLRAYTIKMVILIGFNLGDRIGETRALSFGNISKEYNLINIEHSINYDPKSTTYYKSTKNEHSQRIIDVSDKLINEIEDYKHFLESTFLIKIKKDMPILINLKTMKPYSDTLLRKKFNYYIDKSGVPKIRMYDLRHTFVTTMMSEGWEMYAIANKVGHKKITTTINTYGHITEKIKKEMALTTDKYY